MDCTGRRRKNSFSGEDELRKMARVAWIQDPTQGMNLQQQQQQQQSSIVVQDQHHIMHRLRRDEIGTSSPSGGGPLSLQQRAMAAIALQEIRSSIDPAKHHPAQQTHQHHQQAQLLQKYQQLIHQLKPPANLPIHPGQQQNLQIPSNVNPPLLIDTRYTAQVAQPPVPVPLNASSCAASIPSEDPVKIHPASPQLMNIPPLIFPSSLTSSNSTAPATPSISPPAPARSAAKIQNPICPNIPAPDLQQYHIQSPSPNTNVAAASNNRGASWFSSNPSSCSIELPLRASPVLPAPSSNIFCHGLIGGMSSSGELLDRTASFSVLEQAQEQQQQQMPEVDQVSLQGLTGYSVSGNVIKQQQQQASGMIYNQPSNMISSTNLNSTKNPKNRIMSSATVDQTIADLKNLVSDAPTPPATDKQPKMTNHQSQQQQRQPTRTYTKVYKLGSIGRAVDVARFKNYVELRAELSRMFGLEGQLDQRNGWQLVFVDKENDLLLVGDDPWEEFVNSVRGIRILSPSEVQYYTSDERGAEAV